MSLAGESQTQAYPKTWKKPPFIKSPVVRYGLYLAALVYLVLAIGTIEVNWLRVYEGLDRGAKFVGAFLSPDRRWRSSHLFGLRMPPSVDLGDLKDLLEEEGAAEGVPVA